jgi:sarcosine oxidase gamma subunit
MTSAQEAEHIVRQPGLDIVVRPPPRLIEVADFDRNRREPGFTDPAITAIDAVAPGHWRLWMSEAGDAAGLALALTGRAAVFDLGQGWELIDITGPGTAALLSRGAAVKYNALTPDRGAHLHLWHVDVFAVRRAKGLSLLVPASYAPSLIERLKRAAEDLADAWPA